MNRDISDQEWFVVQRIRKVANEDAHGRGHGDLRVTINDGQPTLVKREISEKVPRAC
jgi:hypothetical protein